jgi:hypothetical protein
MVVRQQDPRPAGRYIACLGAGSFVRTFSAIGDQYVICHLFINSQSSWLQNDAETTSVAAMGTHPGTPQRASTWLADQVTQASAEPTHHLGKPRGGGSAVSPPLSWGRVRFLLNPAWDVLTAGVIPGGDAAQRDSRGHPGWRGVLEEFTPARFHDAVRNRVLLFSLFYSAQVRATLFAHRLKRDCFGQVPTYAAMCYR